MLARRHAWHLIGAVLALTSVASVVAAQGQRTEFTYHLFVDPTNGDDALAAAQNPSTTAGPPFPLQSHPVVAPPQGGILQQAPFAYRTVGAALAWVNTLPANLDGKLLPWTAPNGLVMKYIVIHCLPGLYGPRRTQFPIEEYEPLSGLPWNGETFPLDLPGGVSIQGASALDTIFDARLYEPDAPWPDTSIFRIGGGYSSPETAPDFSGTFIDAVTLRGARGSEYRDGCGVLIYNEAPVKATIGNCFIYNNDVGIAVLREDPQAQSELFHVPRIINNTIAWNAIGLWNGTRYGDPELDNLNRLVLLNNIFDCASPTVYPLPSPPVSIVPAYAAADITIGGLFGISAFEGVSPEDLTVNDKGGCLQAQGVNFNAYEGTASPLPRYNLGNRTAPKTPGGPAYPTLPWPRTYWKPSASNGTFTPRVDLYPFTDSLAGYGTSAQRGDIYINDVFRHDPVWAQPPGAGVPRPSQHDFRIAPMARLAPASNPTSSQLSPLVNVGIDVVGSAAAITMRNGEVVDPSWIPGLPPDAEDVATLNVWDWDCNGYGNPRVQGHVGFADGTACVGNIDLGASELGDPMISGFVDSTRIFSRAHVAVAPQTGKLGNQARRDLLYFFNVYPGPFAGSVGPGFYLRPQFNLAMDWKRTPGTPKPGTRSEWYAQLALGDGSVPGNPYDPMGTSNYTDGDWQSGSLSTRRDLVHDPLGVQAVDFPEFMRNLVCDESPHLYHDIDPDTSQPDQANWKIYYPEWSFQYNLSPTTHHDLFQPDPWYYQSDINYAPPNDNFRLYYDPIKPLRLGLISPPKTVIPLDVTQWLASAPRPLSISYLFWNQSHGIGSWDVAAPIDSLYQVNGRGWGDVHSPPVGFPGGEIVPYVPSNEWQGLRINLELYDPDNASWAALGFHNNLATFLVVQGSGTEVPAMGLDGGQPAAPSSTGPELMMLPAKGQRLERGNAVQLQVQDAFDKLLGTSK